MREIKFRAWNILNKKMLNWGDIFHLPAWEIFPGTPEQRCFEVMQYTGLKDKNGKEIYEGDIIELINEDHEKIKIICEFGTARRDIYGNLIEITGFYFKRLCDDRKTFPIVKNYLGKHDLELYEVVGNIYENALSYLDNKLKIKENLDKRICDIVKDSENTQTYRGMIREG